MDPGDMPISDAMETCKFFSEAPEETSLSPRQEFQCFHFSDFPAEMRLITLEHIMSEIMHQQHPDSPFRLTQARHCEALNLLLVSRTMYNEARCIYYSRVVITLPYNPVFEQDRFLWGVRSKLPSYPSDGSLVDGNFEEAAVSEEEVKEEAEKIPKETSETPTPLSPLRPNTAWAPCARAHFDNITKLTLLLCPGWFLTNTTLSPTASLHDMAANGRLAELQVHITRPTNFISDWGGVPDRSGAKRGFTTTPLLTLMPEFWRFVEVLARLRLADKKASLLVFRDRHEGFWRLFEVEIKRQTRSGEFMEIDFMKLRWQGPKGRDDWFPWMGRSTAAAASRHDKLRQRDEDIEWIQSSVTTAFKAKWFKELKELLGTHENGLTWTAT